ncbi:hypothetical protein L3V79_08950 [Thiotrichales bacterium 19S9-12]|nr:hypothetical protein [Thiotrichales bacterium 19S9-11]MCF6812484.1 hypothetical protein [Thiotrichales bacterium 19S9-12]
MDFFICGAAMSGNKKTANEIVNSLHKAAKSTPNNLSHLISTISNDELVSYLIYRKDPNGNNVFDILLTQKNYEILSGLLLKQTNGARLINYLPNEYLTNMLQSDLLKINTKLMSIVALFDAKKLVPILKHSAQNYSNIFELLILNPYFDPVLTSKGYKKSSDLMLKTIKDVITLDNLILFLVDENTLLKKIIIENKGSFYNFFDELSNSEKLQLLSSPLKDDKRIFDLLIELNQDPEQILNKLDINCLTVLLKYSKFNESIASRLTSLYKKYDLELHISNENKNELPSEIYIHKEGVLIFTDYEQKAPKTEKSPYQTCYD